MLISFCRFDVVSVGSVVCCGELETGKGTGVRVGKGRGIYTWYPLKLYFQITCVFPV